MSDSRRNTKHQRINTYYWKDEAIEVSVPSIVDRSADESRAAATAAIIS